MLALNGCFSREKPYHDQGDSLVWTVPQWTSPLALTIWKRAKGHTHKGHREKVPKVMNLMVFSGCFRGIFGKFEGISGVFRVFFPVPFPGMRVFQGVLRVFSVCVFPMPFLRMPFGPFQKNKGLRECSKHDLGPQSKTMGCFFLGFPWVPKGPCRTKNTMT